MTIHEMFSAYLSQAKLDPSKMATAQYTETRRAFFAGVTSTLAMMIDDAEGTEDEAVLSFDALYQEAQTFWKKQKE